VLSVVFPLSHFSPLASSYFVLSLHAPSVALSGQLPRYLIGEPTRLGAAGPKAALPHLSPPCALSAIRLKTLGALSNQSCPFPSRPLCWHGLVIDEPWTALFPSCKAAGTYDGRIATAWIRRTPSLSPCPRRGWAPFRRAPPRSQYPPPPWGSPTRASSPPSATAWTDRVDPSAAPPAASRPRLSRPR
jgi:hypothetical protein